MAVEIELGLHKRAWELIPVGYVLPMAVPFSSEARYFEVTRVDTETQKVYGQRVDPPEVPWYRANEGLTIESRVRTR